MAAIDRQTKCSVDVDEGESLSRGVKIMYYNPFGATATSIFLGRANALLPPRPASSLSSLMRLVTQILKDPSFAHLSKVCLIGHLLILSDLVHNRFEELPLFALPTRC